jgi:hypothetical protein
VAGTPITIRKAEFHSLASALRMRGPVDDIVRLLRSQREARIGLGEAGSEWGDYVDGAVALRSAIHHARQNGVWDGLCQKIPGLMRLVQTVAEHGTGHLPAETIAEIIRGGGWISVELVRNESGGIACSTHGRDGDAWWASAWHLAEAIERGPTPIEVNDRVLVRDARWQSLSDGRVYAVKESEYLVRIGDDTHWINRGWVAYLGEADGR